MSGWGSLSCETDRVKKEEIAKEGRKKQNKLTPLRAGQVRGIPKTVSEREEQSKKKSEKAQTQNEVLAA